MIEFEHIDLYQIVLCACGDISTWLIKSALLRKFSVTKVIIEFNEIMLMSILILKYSLLEKD